MSWKACTVRTCKLGWGYHEPLDRLIPVEGNPPNAISKVINDERHSNVLNLSHGGHFSLHYLLEPKYRQELDFRIVFDDADYWEYHYQIFTKIEKCKKLHEYPSNCTHYVNQIKYAICLVVIFPKLGFPQNEKEKAKENYRHMSQNDFLKIRLILKSLFYSYIDYIKYALDHLDTLDEGNALPGSVEYLENLLHQLNNWFLIQHDGIWRNCMEAVIFKTLEHNHIVEKLQKTENFKDKEVLISTNLVEPLIGTETNRQGFKFGFIDMSFPETTVTESNLPIFDIKCPQGCSVDSRKWICTKCGDLVKIKVDGNVHGKLFILCFCGRKSFDPNLLKCHQCEEKKKNGAFSFPNPSVLTKNESQKSQVNPIINRFPVAVIEPQTQHEFNTGIVRFEYFYIRSFHTGKPAEYRQQQILDPSPTFAK